MVRLLEEFLKDSLQIIRKPQFCRRIFAASNQNQNKNKNQNKNQNKNEAETQDF